MTDHQPLVPLMDQQVLTWVQTRWLRLGLFQSIPPTTKYQPGKATAVANALIQSQRKEVEDSMDNSAVTVAAIEEQVSSLSGFSVELMEEDLQKWTTTTLYNDCNLCTCTNEPSGEDLCARSLVWK